MAQRISELMTSKQLSAENQETKTAVSCTAVDNKKIDQLIDEYSDLTRTGRNMDGYYASTIRRLGVQKWIILARTARQEGKVPARYFNYLLKNN
jgi:hypothetical protein